MAKKNRNRRGGEIPRDVKVRVVSLNWNSRGEGEDAKRRRHQFSRALSEQSVDIALVQEIGSEVVVPKYRVAARGMAFIFLCELYFITKPNPPQKGNALFS